MFCVIWVCIISASASSSSSSSSCMWHVPCIWDIQEGVYLYLPALMQSLTGHEQ